MAKTFCGQKKTFHSSADCILCLERQTLNEEMMRMNRIWRQFWRQCYHFTHREHCNEWMQASLMYTNWRIFVWNPKKVTGPRSEIVQVGIYFFRQHQTSWNVNTKTWSQIIIAFAPNTSDGSFLQHLISHSRQEAQATSNKILHIHTRTTHILGYFFMPLWYVSLLVTALDTIRYFIPMKKENSTCEIASAALGTLFLCCVRVWTKIQERCCSLFLFSLRNVTCARHATYNTNTTWEERSERNMGRSANPLK